MKNRVLGVAVAAAMALSGAVVAPIREQVQKLTGGDETGAPSDNPRPPRYNRYGGYSVAHGRRLARKRRNVLRSKGQFRKAVR